MPYNFALTEEYTFTVCANLASQLPKLSQISALTGIGFELSELSLTEPEWGVQSTNLSLFSLLADNSFSTIEQTKYRWHILRIDSLVYLKRKSLYRIIFYSSNFTNANKLHQVRVASHILLQGLLQQTDLLTTTYANRE